MKTPKRLYPSARIIYHPELSACPVCGGPLMLANYLLGDKTVQTLTAVVSVASRPTTPTAATRSRAVGPIRRLCCSLSPTRRPIYRDIQALCAAGVPVITERHSGSEKFQH